MRDFEGEDLDLFSFVEMFQKLIFLEFSFVDFIAELINFRKPIDSTSSSSTALEKSTVSRLVSHTIHGGTFVPRLHFAPCKYCKQIFPLPVLLSCLHSGVLPFVFCPNKSNGRSKGQHGGDDLSQRRQLLSVSPVPLPLGPDCLTGRILIFLMIWTQ